MTTWKTCLKNLWIAIWHYLTRPSLDKSNNATTLDPWKFDRHNKIQFLEDCWRLNDPSETHS